MRSARAERKAGLPFAHSARVRFAPIRSVEASLHHPSTRRAAYEMGLRLSKVVVEHSGEKCHAGLRGPYGEGYPIFAISAPGESFRDMT